MGASIEKPATERQRRILEIIREFTAEHGYPPSVREIGERVGLSSSSTIHAHLKALERRGLISRDPTKPRALRSSAGPLTHNALVVPILGRVAAGVPIAAQEDVEGEFLLPSDYVPRASDAFMLRVQGDSMVDAAILDGDLILVRPQRSAENGEIVVAIMDGEATVKRFYREAGRIRLQPENRAMAPIYASDVEIVGRVEAVVRRL
ncbi:MAG TPA: transcriptional repressor LexA [Candidatus Cybelea sp.]